MLPKLLIVDDEPGFRTAMSRYLSRAGFAVSDAASLRAARASLASNSFQAMLLDLQLPDGDGLEWIDEIRARHRDMTLVVITGRSEIPIAVEAMRRGADDFVTKPVEPRQIVSHVRRFLDGCERRSPRERTRVESSTVLLGTSAPAAEMRRLAEMAASSESVVLITGETGAGKGVLARWIHDHGSRRTKGFVEVNCSTLRGELLANELFGHARGAFTSAADAQPGLLDAADGGTLFLDEIGDMDPAIQAQFLKTVEEKRYRRLGDVTMRRSDFRLMCATNHSLEDDVAEGRFRSDLFYRINVVPIHVPPLRDRLSDIEEIARHLLPELPGSPSIDVSAIARLETHEWPGNVRELRNILERAALVARDAGVIAAEHLEGFTGRREAQSAQERMLESADVVAAVMRNGGDKEQAARELGISRATLYRRLQGLKRASQ